MNKAAIVLLFLMDIIGIAFLTSILALGLILMGQSIIPSFAISFVVVCGVGLVNNSIQTRRVNRDNRLIDLELAKINSTSALHVSCAYCRVENIKLIDLSNEMTFNCVSCKQPNKILLQYGAARMTSPINVDVNLNEIISDSDLDLDGLKEEAQ